MKVLVTGATGFVGVNLIPYLINQGLDVRVLIRGNNGSLFSNVEVFQGDVTNLESVLYATKNIDSVFHLAGVVGYSRSQRSLMESVNVVGTQNILSASTQNRVRRILHFSSVAAIGASHTPTSLNENSQYNLSDYNLGYFETKRKAESIILSAAKNSVIDAVSVNPSTIYGYADALKGSRRVQVKVAKGVFPFYPPGGASVVAIEDVVAATFEAWKSGRTGERYILSGENLYIKDIFSMIAEEAGVHPPRIALSKNILLAIGKVGDILERMSLKGPINSENAVVSSLFHWFDSTKARNELKFNPRPARTAIKNSVLWMRENGII